jgi:hypothetical protein
VLIKCLHKCAILSQGEQHHDAANHSFDTFPTLLGLGKGNFLEDFLQTKPKMRKT